MTNATGPLVSVMSTADFMVWGRFYTQIYAPFVIRNHKHKLFIYF